MFAFELYLKNRFHVRFFAYAAVYMCACLYEWVCVCLSLLYAYKLRLSVICTTRSKAFAGVHEKNESPTISNDNQLNQMFSPILFLKKTMPIITFSADIVALESDVANSFLVFREFLLSMFSESTIPLLRNN